MTNAQILAEKLYVLRKQSGISQEELADKLGVSRQAVSKWERGEAMPDTENLIAISKLYKTSLDELIGNDFTKADTSAENKSANADCSSIAEDEENKTTSNASSDGDVHVEIGNGRIVVDVKARDDDEDEDLDDDDEDELYDLETDKKGERKIFRVLRRFPYPIAVTVAYLLWGILSPSGIGWRVGWTLFLTVPLYYNIIDCISHKSFSSFAYPVFITFAYLFIGMVYSIWHPTWIIFITVPIYYVIADAIDKA